MRNLVRYQLVLALIVVSMFSFVNAQPPVTTAQNFPEGFLIADANTNYIKIDAAYTHHWFLYNASNGYRVDNSTVVCMFFMADNVGELLYGDNATYNNEGYWSVTIPSAIINESKIYYFGISCQDGGIGGSLDGAWEATIDGEEKSLENLYANILLLIFIVAIILIIGYKHKETDFDAWDEKIISGHKNMGQTMASGLVYSLFKNTFLWYYALGWLILFILKDVIINYVSLEIYNYFTLITDIYSIGFLLVVVFMIGYTITYMRNMVNVLTENNWGVGEK